MKAFLYLFAIALTAGCTCGWVLNIIKICHADVVTSGMMIARIIGVFVPPVGAVLGFF